MLKSYQELGYKVHTKTKDYTILLKRNKVISGIVLDQSGQTHRILNGIQIDKLLKGKDIMATQATTKPKATTKPATQYSGTETTIKRNGACVQVHKICDEIYAKKKDDMVRKDVIAACVAKGINKSTAATQWHKWATAKWDK